MPPFLWDAETRSIISGLNILRDRIRNRPCLSQSIRCRSGKENNKRGNYRE
jgi:hypothetical protein